MSKTNVSKGSNLYQYLATFSGAFGLVSYGISTSWTSPFLPYLTSNSSIIPMTNEEGSWLAMSPLFGCPVGAILAGLVADRLGRKWSILYMAPIVFVCSICIAFTKNIWILHTLRFLIGITDGASFTIVPMYIGEISSPDIRGFLTSLTTLYFILGTLIINTIGSFWDIYTCALISAVVPVLHFVTFIFMPESPYWYLKVGKNHKAEESLKILRKTLDVSQQFEIIKAAVEEDNLSKKSSFKDLFTIRSNRKACLICFIVTCQERATAKAPLTFYLRTIFEQTGSSISSTTSSIAYCLVQLVVVTVSAYFIVDRFGKKNLTVISVIGSIIPLFALGLYFVFKDLDYQLMKYLDWLPLASLVVYILFNGIGISFAPFCYASELFPTSVKANALTLAELNMVITGIVSAKLFQMTGDYFDTLSIPFLLFTGFSILFLIFVVKMVPETKDYTLEEIQLFLKTNRKI